MAKIYKHYKGNRYEYIGECWHSETVEEMVIYKALYGEGKTWVRPKEMFFGNVQLADGSIVPRFAPEVEEPILNAHNKDEHEPAHTAEHLLNQTMIRMFGCERSKNAHIERKKSKINYNLPTCPTPEQIGEIERIMNELISQDLPVTYEFVTREQIPAGVVLDKLPEDASETLRIVRIGDYDICACIGKHVASTKQIGLFRITSTSYNEGSFRIVYKVD